jgi:recombination protein RecA
VDDNKGKALSAALAQIEKQFGKGSIMKMGEAQVQNDLSVVSTGSLGLDLALGVGAADLTLPDKSGFSGQVNTAIGQTTIRIPEGAPVQITADGLSFVDAPSDFTNQDRIYSSPSYAAADSTKQIHLTVSQALGLIKIEYVK